MSGQRPQTPSADAPLGNQVLDTRFTERSLDRISVDWRVAVKFPKGKSHQVIQARAKNITVGGLGIFSDYTIPVNVDVLVAIFVPPLTQGEKEKILEVKSRCVYSVLKGNGFQVGIQFMGFSPGDREYLQKRLEVYG